MQIMKLYIETTLIVPHQNQINWELYKNDKAILKFIIGDQDDKLNDTNNGTAI